MLASIPTLANSTKVNLEDPVTMADLIVYELHCSHRIPWAPDSYSALPLHQTFRLSLLLNAPIAPTLFRILVP